MSVERKTIEATVETVMREAGSKRTARVATEHDAGVSPDATFTVDTDIVTYAGSFETAFAEAELRARLRELGIAQAENARLEERTGWLQWDGKSTGGQLFFQEPTTEPPPGYTYKMFPWISLQKTVDAIQHVMESSDAEPVE